MAWVLGCFGGCPQLIRKPHDHSPTPYPYPPCSSHQKERSARFSEDFGQPNCRPVSVVGQDVDVEYSPPLCRTVSSKQGEWSSPSFNGNGIRGDGTPLSLRSQALLASRSMSCDKRKRMPSSSLPYVMRRDPISQMEELERELEEIKQKLILESEEAKKLRDEVRQLRACDKPLQAGETNGSESQVPRVEEAAEKSQTPFLKTSPVKNIPVRPDLILPDREEEPAPDKCFPSSSFQQDSTAHRPPQMQAQSELHFLSSMGKNGVSRDEKQSQYEKNPFLQQYPWPVQRKPSLAENPAGVKRVSPDPLIISRLKSTTPPSVPPSETFHNFNGERSFSSRSDTSVKSSIARKRRRVSQDQQRNPNALLFFTTHQHRLSDGSKANNVTKTLQKRPESNFVSNPSTEPSIVSSESNTSVTTTTTATVSSSNPSLPASSNGGRSYSWTDSVREITESYGEESDFDSEEVGGSLNQPLNCPSPLLISALRRFPKGSGSEKETVSNNSNDYSMTEEETRGTTESNTVSEEDGFIDADSHASASSVATNQKENRRTRTSTITNAYPNPKSNPNPNYSSSTVQRSFSSRHASPSVLNSVENIPNWKQFRTTTDAMPPSTSNNRKNSLLGATNENGKHMNPTFLGRDSRSCREMEIEDYSDSNQARSSSDSIRVDASLKHWLRRSISSKGSGGGHRSSESSSNINSRSGLSQQSGRSSSSWSSAASNGHLFGAPQPRISSLQPPMYGKKKKQGLNASS